MLIELVPIIANHMPASGPYGAGFWETELAELAPIDSKVAHWKKVEDCLQLKITAADYEADCETIDKVFAERQAFAFPATEDVKQE